MLARRATRPAAPRARWYAIAVVGTHRSRPGAPYQRLRERQRSRARAAGVSVAAGASSSPPSSSSSPPASSSAGGWAQDVWDRFAGPASASAPGAAGATASPAAVGVLITGVTHAVAVDPPPPIDARGDGVKVSTFLGDETRRVYGLGPPPEPPLPHLEDDHRQRPDLAACARRATSRTSPSSRRPGRAPAGPVSPSSSATRSKLYLVVGGFDHNLHKIELDHRQGRLGVRLRRHHQEQPDGDRGPEPGRRQRQVPRARRLAPRLPQRLHRPEPRAVPRRLVRHRQGGLAPARAAHRELQPRRGRQRLLLQGPHVLGGRERVVLQARPLRDERLERLPDAGRSSPSRLLLGDPGDASAHGGNLVLEASPSLLDDVVYISSGSGHVYGMRRSDLKVVWDYTHRQRPGRHAGADVRRQAARGRGEAVHQRARRGPHAGPVQGPGRVGGLVLPHRRPHARRLGGRRDRVGGRQRQPTTRGAAAPASPPSSPSTATSTSSRRTGRREQGPGPNGDGPYPTPRVVAKFSVGGGISTPIMVDDSIVAAGYDNQVHLYDDQVQDGREGRRRRPQEPRRRLVHGRPSTRRTPSPAAAPSRARR